MFLIRDDRHDDSFGEFASLEQAAEELERFAVIPWDQKPNKAPCTNWQKCGRSYEVIEYDNNFMPWKTIRVIPALDISQSEIIWDPEFTKTSPKNF